MKPIAEHPQFQEAVSRLAAIDDRIRELRGEAAAIEASIEATTAETDTQNRIGRILAGATGPDSATIQSLRDKVYLTRRNVRVLEVEALPAARRDLEGVRCKVSRDSKSEAMRTRGPMLRRLAEALAVLVETWREIEAEKAEFETAGYRFGSILPGTVAPFRDPERLIRDLEEGEVISAREAEALRQRCVNDGRVGGTPSRIADPGRQSVQSTPAGAYRPRLDPVACG